MTDDGMASSVACSRAHWRWRDGWKGAGPPRVGTPERRGLREAPSTERTKGVRGDQDPGSHIGDHWPLAVPGSWAPPRPGLGPLNQLVPFRPGSFGAGKTATCRDPRFPRGAVLV